jgi:hypothetical protein
VTVDASDAGVDAPAETSPSCSPVNGSCSGGLLTCNPNFSSCNGSNADGCECSTPACCGTACQTRHLACLINGTPCSDGTGLPFYDCVALGTINSAQATKACAAVIGNASACSMGQCGAGPTLQLAIYGFDAAGNCVSWAYSGSNTGRMFKSASAMCYCPSSTAPTWN